MQYCTTLDNRKFSIIEKAGVKPKTFHINSLEFEQNEKLSYYMAFIYLFPRNSNRGKEIEPII